MDSSALDGFGGCLWLILFVGILIGGALFYLVPWVASHLNILWH